MGIKDLFKTKIPGTDKTIDDLGSVVKMEDLSGQAIVVDGNWAIHNAVETRQQFTNADGKPTTHLYLNYMKICRILRCKIKQFWVFDNPQSTPLKDKTNKKRKAAKVKREENQRFRIIVLPEFYTEIKEFLQILGIPYIQAPPGIEAEQIAANLTVQRRDGDTIINPLYDWVFTGDSDVLTFGGNLLRWMKDTGGKKKNSESLKQFSIKYVLKEIGVGQNKFNKYCVALGSDFNERIKGCGPATVINKVDEGKAVFDEEHKEALNFFNRDISGDILATLDKMMVTVPEKEKFVNYMKQLNLHKGDESKIEKEYDDYMKLYSAVY